MQTLLPSNPTANYIPMRNTHTHQKTRTRTFPAALFETALKWKLSKCPLALERENEMWYIYKVEHQTATRMNGLVTRAYSVHKTWSIPLDYPYFTKLRQSFSSGNHGQRKVLEQLLEGTSKAEQLQVCSSEFRKDIPPRAPSPAPSPKFCPAQN